MARLNPVADTAFLLKRYSYRELEEKTGINPSTLWRILKGKTTASPLVSKTLRIHVRAEAAKDRRRARNNGAA